MKTNLICVLLLSFFLVKMDAFAQKAVIKVAWAQFENLGELVKNTIFVA